MIRTLSLAVLAAISLWAQSPNILGDWQGTLKVGLDDIHLTLHIKAGPNDTLKATMDSAEQGARGVAVSTIEFKEPNFHLTVDSIHATYTATVNRALTVIDGTWSQGQPIPLTFARPPKTPDTAKSDAMEGTWQGTLQIGGRPLHLVFHLTPTIDGLSATMDSPDQGATDVPVISARREGDVLTLQMPNIAAKYQGTVGKDGASIQGSFTQGGASLPLALNRTSVSQQDSGKN